MTWGGPQPASPAYPEVDAWLRDWFAPRYRRSFDTGGRVWCPAWREHPEAVSRLTALWAAWQDLHDRPAGLATWWLTHADPTLDALTDERGPFARCRAGHTDRLPPLDVG